MRTRTLPNRRSVKVRDNGGLKKRCRCPRRKWSKCAHPWHFGFAQNGKEYRWSLHRVAEKPPGYWMSKTEAQAIADRLRSDIRVGRLTDTGTASTIGDMRDPPDARPSPHASRRAPGTAPARDQRVTPHGPPSLPGRGAVRLYALPERGVTLHAGHPHYVPLLAQGGPPS